MSRYVTTRWGKDSGVITASYQQLDQQLPLGGFAMEQSRFIGPVIYERVATPLTETEGESIHMISDPRNFSQY